MREYIFIAHDRG